MSWKKEQVAEAIASEWNSQVETVRNWNAQYDAEHHIAPKGAQFSLEVGGEQIDSHEVRNLGEVKALLDKWVLRLQECTASIHTTEGSFILGKASEIAEELRDVENASFGEGAIKPLYQKIGEKWVLGSN